MKVLFFASCADWAGRRELEIALAGRKSLREAVAGRREFQNVIGRPEVKVAVNCEYADLNAEVGDGDEVAFMPPVCGG